MKTIHVGISPIMGVMVGFEYYSEKYEDYTDHYFILDFFILCFVISVEKE